MLVDYFVFLHGERLPTIAEWQHALNEIKSGIVLDQIDDLRSHVGYLPVCYNDSKSGFEWFFGPVNEIFGDKPEVIGNRSHAIDFVTHSDLQELICCMIAGAVLAKIADGLVFDENTGTFVDGNKALQIAREVEANNA